MISRLLTLAVLSLLLLPHGASACGGPALFSGLNPSLPLWGKAGAFALGLIFVLVSRRRAALPAACLFAAAVLFSLLSGPRESYACYDPTIRRERPLPRQAVKPHRPTTVPFDRYVRY